MSSAFENGLHDNNNSPIETENEDIRNLVVDFIKYKLENCGYKALPVGLTSVPVSVTATTLRAVGDEFEKRYTTTFDSLGDRLQIANVDLQAGKEAFEGVAMGIFASDSGVKDQLDISWGRLVGLFVFASNLAKQAMDKELSSWVECIVEWTTTFIADRAMSWVTANGGWDGFVQFYTKRHPGGGGGGSEGASGVWNMGLLGIGAVTLGALAIFARRAT